ncbi:MAG TPA: inositol monophosphatase family protein, partial [Candidatus Binatus sp.]|nr:inositol monophosphatase family protein [Candidatus Binatus sp.]
MPLPQRAVLEKIAQRAGAIALTQFRRVKPERKADRTLVTAADREVEAAIVSELEPLLPDAAILGEEGTA